LAAPKWGTDTGGAAAMICQTHPEGAVGGDGTHYPRSNNMGGIGKKMVTTDKGLMAGWRGSELSVQFGG